MRPVTTPEIDTAQLFRQALADPSLLESLKGALGMAPSVHPDTPITPDQRAQAFTKVVQHGMPVPKPVPFQTYPAMRYHETKGTTLVRDAVEEKRLGAGWVDSPAKFAEAVSA